MSRFQRISVDGFRRLIDVHVELRPLTVLIGANGVGKTSVLEAIALLGSSARGSLRLAISELSGLRALLTYDRAQSLTLGISAVDTSVISENEPLEYSLRIRPQGLSYGIEEKTPIQRRSNVHPPFKYFESHGADVRYFTLDHGEFIRPEPKEFLNTILRLCGGDPIA